MVYLPSSCRRFPKSCIIECCKNVDTFISSFFIFFLVLTGVSILFETHVIRIFRGCSSQVIMIATIYILDYYYVIFVNVLPFLFVTADNVPVLKILKRCLLYVINSRFEICRWWKETKRLLENGLLLKTMELFEPINEYRYTIIMSIWRVRRTWVFLWFPNGLRFWLEHVV